MKEFVTAVQDAVDTAEGVPVEEQHAEFMLDGREMRAYKPLDGQMAFMLANMGRGQTADQRFTAIVNVLMSCLRPEDRDYFESRLLERDPKKRLGIKTIEEVFVYCTEEWFREALPDDGAPVHAG